jgi:diguanylate cyclase (GGDEF)-like protein
MSASTQLMNIDPGPEQGIPDPGGSRFVTEPQLARWLARLPGLAGNDLTRMRVLLAWHLRERDPVRARALAAEAEGGLDASDDPDGRLRARLALVRAELQWLYAEPGAAAATAEIARQRYAVADDARGLSDVHWLLAWIAVDEGDLDRRDKALEASAACAEAAGDSLRSGLAELALARSAVFRDLPAAMARWGSRFLAAGSHVDPSLMVWVEDFRGLVASKTQRIGDAIAHGIRMFEAASTTGQVQRAITAAANIGFDLTRLNEHPAALEWMQRALDLARARKWPASLGLCLTETAETLRQLDRLDAAHEMLQEALDVLAPFGRTRARALVLNYLGDVALDRGDHAGALGHFDHLSTFADALAQADLQAIAARGRAHALGALGRTSEALAAASAALDMSSAQHDDYNQIAALRVMAGVHAREHGEGGMALDLLTQALVVARGIDGYITPPELLEAAARGHAARGEPDTAYRLCIEAIASRDRIHNEQSMQRAVAMQVRRETEAARAEAEQQRKLAEAEAQRAAVLQDTTHTLERLGAIGQAITATLSIESVLHLLAAQIRDLLDSDSFGIYLLQADGHTLASAVLIEHGQTLQIDRFALDNPLRHAARCAREQVEIALQRDAPDGDPSQLPGSLATLSAIFSPLLIGERLLGVMTVQSVRRDAYGERERLIFRTLAAYGAIALENAAAYRELEHAHHELGGLSDLSSRLQSCVDVDEAYRCLARAAETLFPGSRGALYRGSVAGTLALHAGWGIADHAGLPATLACRAISAGRAAWHAGEHGAHCCDPASRDDAWPARACLPMADEDGNVFGALVVDFPGISDAVGADRRYPLALALAEQTTLALANLRLREALHEQSIRDGLTGVFNRRYLDVSLVRELNRCRAHRLSLAVAMVDIDHFKSINDQHGHAAGDAVLRSVAETIQHAFRCGDVVCRYGGEEFAVLLADASEAVALARAEALRVLLHGLQLQHEGCPIGPLTVSVGVAIHPRHADAPEALIGAADRALYAAKQGGRDQVRLASDIDGTS